MKGTGGARKALKISDQDNIATAIEEISLGDTIAAVSEEGDVSYLQAVDGINFGHKVALEVVEIGGEVIKYGQSIGIATNTIRIGEHVHTHNLVSARAKVEDPNG